MSECPNGILTSEQLMHDVVDIRFFEGQATRRTSHGRTEYTGAVQISAKEAFKTVYKGLEEVIKHNQATVEIKRRGGDRANREWLAPRDDKEEELLGIWHDTLPVITAVLETHSGPRELTVTPRNDLEYRNHPNPRMQQPRFRLPNILYLEDQSGPVVIMRAARTWGNPTRKEAARKQFNSAANYRWLNTFDRGAGHDLRNLILGQPHTGALIIPEPYLHGALEQLYKDDQLERITPRMLGIEADTENGDIYFLRAFLDSAKDRPLKPEVIGGYAGQLHSVGLFGAYDRQVAHYCWQKTRKSDTATMVDIDPDFYFWTDNPKTLDDDFGRLLHTLSHSFPNVRRKREIIKAVRQQALSSEDNNPYNLIDHLPRRIGDLPQMIPWMQEQ